MVCLAIFSYFVEVAQLGTLPQHSRRFCLFFFPVFFPHFFLLLFVNSSLKVGYFIPNSNSFGVFSHSKGFGAEFAFGLSMFLWGRSILGCSKVPRKVPPRFHRGSTKVPPRLRKFRYLSGLLGQIVLGCQKVPRKVPARVHQGSTKVLQVSWCLWFSRADPFWAAKRFRLKRFCGRFTKVPPRFHRGSTKVSPRQIRFGVPKGSVEGSPITSLNLCPSSSTLFCMFPQQR